MIYYICISIGLSHVRGPKARNTPEVLMNFLEYLKTMIAGSMSSVSNLVIYVAIVILFVAGLIRCVVPVVRTRGLIRRAIRSIRAGGDKKYSRQ